MGKYCHVRISPTKSRKNKVKNGFTTIKVAQQGSIWQKEVNKAKICYIWSNTGKSDPIRVNNIQMS